MGLYDDFNIVDGKLNKYTGMDSIITVPNSITKITSYAFSDNIFLEDVYIHDSVREIENSAFNGCTNLENVTISDKVLSIGTYAFNGCPKLTLKVTKGSFAYKYAEENELNFEIVEE